MSELCLNIIGTIVGGLLLTLFLFLLNEYIFPKKNLTGEWVATIKITKTSYSRFNNLSMEYKIHLLQKDYELSGSGEKIRDINSDGTETIFLRENRVQMSVEGYFERKYFAKSKVYLNIHEEGRKRNTRATYFLVFNNHNELEGTFISTAADACGTINLKK